MSECADGTGHKNHIIDMCFENYGWDYEQMIMIDANSF